MSKKISKNNDDFMINAYIEGSGKVLEQPIIDTLQKNYMPYAMSVIISRALPQIDGFKPSHRKILYTMYKMNLLGSTRTKSANIVGQTMKLNPHGDSAIYETMVRLSRGYSALLHPYIDSKGNFGKFYSRDMAYAASRYTEVKLSDICNEFFKDIDKSVVDFVANYDNTTKEPILLPTTFPSILINSNVGIAVSMASSICSFNLKEVCESTIELIKNEDYDISKILKGPDFSGGGLIVYNQDDLNKIFNTGRGSIKIRSRYTYDKEYNCIEITEIPPTTTIESIIDKVIELIKNGKVKEISDIRDESGLSGLKITIDLKKGINPDILMQKLYKLTTLEDIFSCNFNILIDYKPKVMGVYEILKEWLKFRIKCVKNRTEFTLKRKKDKLHLLEGLAKILLDIDKAIFIIRETDQDADVIPNLMRGFEIDKLQAEYVAEIKLRNLNKEYILNKINNIESLKSDILELEDTLKSEIKIKNIICKELKDVIDDYSQPRKSLFVYVDEDEQLNKKEEISKYQVNIFLTKDGYFKKILPKSLRMNNEHKLKQDDKIISHILANNNHELLFFTDKSKVYKSFIDGFNESKASLLGEYLPAKLKLEEDEKIIYMINTEDYSGNILFFFDNGKINKIPLSLYYTKTKRKKLSNAYSNKSKLIGIFFESDNNKIDYFIETVNKNIVVLNSTLIDLKNTRDSQGTHAILLDKNDKIEYVKDIKDVNIKNIDKYRINSIPSKVKNINNDNINVGIQLKI